MSALYDFKTSTIKVDSITNQIAKGVHELRRNNVPGPFTVQLTQMQFDTLRFECRRFATQFSVEEGNHIHGCKIEVIQPHNASVTGLAPEKGNK